MKKIVMFDGEIETQAYFTYQMRDAFEKMGFEVLIFNLSKIGGSFSKLIRFVEKDNTALVSFNFHGHTLGDVFQNMDDGTWFWDVLNAPCYNIVVDHPYYYHRFLEKLPKYYVHVSIDRNHDAYMQRFFPDIRRIPFLPLAGTQLDPLTFLHAKDLAPAYQNIPSGMQERDYISSLLTPQGFLKVEARPYDVVFTGNYSDPHKFDKYIYRNGEEYACFYQKIIQELIQHSSRTVEEVTEQFLREEIPEITQEELRQTLSNIIFLDLYVRSYIRGKAVQVLVDNGLKVAVFGGGWEELICEHPENILDGHGVDSLKCLQMMQLSKCSLNVMPWFKDGAHDRVFNTLLNGSLLVTDTSVYLEEILHSNEDCIMFQLETIEELPDQIKTMLAEPEKLQRAINKGYEIAKKGHTWEQRAKVLASYIEKGDLGEKLPIKEVMNDHFNGKEVLNDIN